MPDASRVGAVAAQSPPAGSEVRKDTAINLEIFGPVESLGVEVGDYLIAINLL